MPPHGSMRVDGFRPWDGATRGGPVDRGPPGEVRNNIDGCSTPGLRRGGGFVPFRRTWATVPGDGDKAKLLAPLIEALLPPGRRSQSATR